MPAWSIVPRGGQRDTLGEGTLWSARENAVYWVDILGRALNRLSLADGTVERVTMPEPIGWVAERAQGGMIAGLKSGFHTLTRDPLRLDPMGDPERDLPDNRMNDGKADAAGAIWCGTMAMDGKGEHGSLYRLDADHSWQRMDTAYGITNGPAFSPDGRWLYHTDTARRTVYRFARNADGTLGQRVPYIRFAGDDGYPDGMTVDAEGGLWIAHWGGARVSRFVDGVLDRAIPLPARQVTNICFGGDALDRMFISSAATDLPESKADGAFFEVDAGVVGLPPGLFAG